MDSDSDVEEGSSKSKKVKVVKPPKKVPLKKVMGNEEWKLNIKFRASSPTGYLFEPPRRTKNE